MKRIYLVSAALLATSGAFAYKPETERVFSEVASSGCSNHDGDFILRGLVSSADEESLVLSDPNNQRSTLSVTLPGRGPFARAKGWFGENKFEASEKRLNQLRETRTPVVVSLKCKGHGTPVALNISYENSDGTNGSINF
jgi:hypothetical protein